jgi:hypothetical protein
MLRRITITIARRIFAALPRVRPAMLAGCCAYFLIGVGSAFAEWGNRVLISEFMAANNTTLTNNFGRADDWIELHNNTTTTVNLAGWHLTDNADNLTKWTFPAAVLTPGSYLVVWASDENTATNGQIHTSFRLGVEGEYLALVRPDGTVEHEYAPQFPAQRNDVSYGVDLLQNGTDLTLLPEQAGCRVLVPASDIGAAWRNRIYDDSTWLTGGTGVGYETTGTEYEENINTDVQGGMYNLMPSVYMRIPFQVTDPALFTQLKLHVLFEDGFVAYLNGVEVARSNAPINQAWNASATATRDPNAALMSTTFPIAQTPTSLLMSGTNVLAIHAMNQSAAAASFLIQPSLEATLANGVTVLQPRYYAQPTPGQPNSGGFLGLVAGPEFSANRGFYFSPFSVAITCPTAGAAIRYTLDGSTPSEVNGTLYTAPIPVNTTTTLRAIAYRTGWQSSAVDTHTYIFTETVLTQATNPPGWPSRWTGTVTFDAYINWSDYEMDPQIIGAPNHLANAVRTALTNIPTISLVTDLGYLFDHNTGIYTNPREQGVAWERPVSAELIYPDGTAGFQINCGIRLQGNGSRGPSSTPKHSLRLLFKGIYGPTKLNHPLFAGSDVESFDTIHLRAIYNNSWPKAESDQRARAQYNQDQFARDLQLAINQKSVHGNVCHLYINGLYWGLYHPGERPDAAWAAAHFGGEKDEWDALNAGVAVDGTTAAWNDLWSRANQNLSVWQNYTNFTALCDVTSLSDYLIIMHYVDIQDWDSKNTYAVRRRAPGDTFKFICWDSERSLERPTGNSAFTVNNNLRPSGLFQRARTNAEFRLHFADRVHKHLFNDGAMTPDRATNLWRQRSDVIDTVIAAESARWGDFRQERGQTTTIYTPAAHYFPYQSNLLHNFFPGRAAFLLNEYLARGLYPALAAPTFNQHGGMFSNTTSISISGPSTIYYTTDGSDPRQYGTGAILGTPYTGSINLSHSTRVKARSFDGTTWSALLEADFFDVAPSSLRISELMYAPRPPAGAELPVSSDPEAFAFVELHNSGSEPVGLPGVAFIEGIRFDFATAATHNIAPGDYAVLVKNRAAFAVRYPAVPAAKILGEYQGNLAQSGESLKLNVHGVGTVISFEYRGGSGWPLPAERAGHSLVPLLFDDQSSDRLSYGGNWKASVNVDGSPGATEPTPHPCLAINEIAAHTDFNDPAHLDYDSNDWIELINCSTSTLLLDGYYLSDGPAHLKKWAIPTGIQLAPGERIVFDEVSGFHSPITNGFGLDKTGEQVLLSYAAGSGPASVVDFVQFKGQENGRTLGRYPDASGEWFACEPTPGTANIRTTQEPVISEIMYHPPPIIPGADNLQHEYIEIYNPTPTDVNLWETEQSVYVGSWRVTGQVEYTFPPNTVLGAGSRVLIVPFHPETDPAAKADFSTRYGLLNPVNLFGPFMGNLSNQGGRVALEKPMAADPPEENLSWVIVDEVYYFDKFQWLPDADGAGHALHRILVSAAGRDPASWTAAAPTPLSDSTGIPELHLGISQSLGQLKLTFDLPPGFDYEIEMKTNSFANDWVSYATVTNPATEHVITLPPEASSAYFRLRRNP